MRIFLLVLITEKYGTKYFCVTIKYYYKLGCVTVRFMGNLGFLDIYILASKAVDYSYEKESTCI